MKTNWNVSNLKIGILLNTILCIYTKGIYDLLTKMCDGYKNNCQCKIINEMVLQLTLQIVR